MHKRPGTRERSNLSAERCRSAQGRSCFPGKRPARIANDLRNATSTAMHGSENGIDNASRKGGVYPIPRRFTGVGMINGFMPSYPTSDRLRANLGRRTSAASEMSPLKHKSRDKPFENDYHGPVDWRKPEYKYTPFKRGPKGAPIGAEQNEKGSEHEDGYGKPTVNDSEKAPEKVPRGKSEADDGHTTSGRGTPNSLAAAWRNSHTLHRSVGDITVESGIQSYQHVTMKPQSAQISPSSVKRLPLSLPHAPSGYAPFMMYNPANGPSRPWSTCGFPPPWQIDPSCNGHVESNEIPAAKVAVEKAAEREPSAKMRFFWRPLKMTAILQLVLGMTILITGVIRTFLEAYMAVGFDIFVGLFVIVVQGITIAAITKNNLCLMAAGYTASVVQCSLLGLPVFASLQSLQRADANTPIHQYVVDVFIVALCLCDLAVVAISLSYACYVIGGKFRISEKEKELAGRCDASSSELQLGKKEHESNEDTK